MGDATTFPIALAEMRAECGEPTTEGGGIAAWLRDGSGDVRVLLIDDGTALWITALRRGSRSTSWALCGATTNAFPLTPLADAVRDAGAWLRGRDGHG